MIMKVDDFVSKPFGSHLLVFFWVRRSIFSDSLKKIQWPSFIFGVMEFAKHLAKWIFVGGCLTLVSEW